MTPANFSAIFTARKPPRSGSAVASAPRSTARPPLKKKNGVRSENATTRKRRCSSGWRWNTRATASPSRNAGSTAWLSARSATHMSRKRAANAPLISGSMTRSPYRRKNHRCSASMTTMTPTDTAMNSARKGDGRAKRIESASTVPRSVTKVAAMMILPISVRVSPVSTRTAYTTADEDGLLELLPHHAGVDLGPGEEGQYDARERGEEVDGRRRRHSEDVPGEHAKGDLEDGDGDAQLDAHHRRDEHEEAEDGRLPERVHAHLRRGG